MALARNKKPDASAIAAFGAAAEARPDDAAAAAAAQARTTKVTKPSPVNAGEEQRPKSSLVRWTDEDLRDRLIDYSKRERYSLQHLMIEALKIGLDQIEKR
ncbi:MULTISPECIES: hypothetical protein [Cryobacterium]|uniref:CopG family transcriptional regulator n=1 Tax=Cryobacterium breve TaxID=1259258 RepID=A0ABY2J1R9_9MICO|nr:MULTISPECIES: hypothetical protein [Cryobacterium]TFC93011.1 hypothetical protein E3T20_11170 [Cryobacterium sp. TmT3-12]TFC98872.1 hypothetical protein E3O65_06965 [Cryobacterium breve]